MRPPSFTIAGLMITVVLAATVLAVFRAGSLMGLVSLLPFAITALIAGFGSSPSVRRLTLAVGAVGVLLFPFLVAIWINHELWGYYVSRPAVDRRIVEAPKIETITHVKTAIDARGIRAFSGAAIEDVEPYLQVNFQEGDYYVLEGRVLRALKDREVLPKEVRELAPSRLESLYQILDESGRLEDGEPGYADAKNLSGVAVEALDRDGRPLLFVAVRGREVSNDHYPFYEFLFKSDSPGGPLKLLSAQRFYYDVAGIEGMEWPGFLLIFAFIGLIPTIPVQGFLIWRGRRRA